MNQLWRTILDADPYWTIGAWTLLIAGILLLLYALFRDRPGLLGIPRERCTRCRYDMTGTAGPTDEQPEITCPECGRSFTSRKPLRRTRRHWKLVALALLLMLGRYAAIHKDRIRIYGWHELIPTAVVIFWIDPERWHQYYFVTDLDTYRSSDRVLYRVRERLDVSAGWERDVWIHRLSPVLNEQGTWSAYRVGDIIDYEVDYVYRGYTVYFGHWYPTGPEMSYQSEYTLDDLRDLIIMAVDTDEWVEMGGDVNAFFALGDRIIVQAPEHTLTDVQTLVDELDAPAAMPKSPNDAIRFGDKWALRFSFHDLGKNMALACDPGDPFNTHLDGCECTDEIIDSFVVQIDYDDWEANGGFHHQALELNDELWIISTKDIRQQVIDAAHRIMAEGAEQILKTND